MNRISELEKLYEAIQGLSIKLGAHYAIWNDDLKRFDGVWQLIDIMSTNLGSWLKFKNLETGEETTLHRKREYMLKRISGPRNVQGTVMQPDTNDTLKALRYDRSRNPIAKDVRASINPK